MKSTHLAFAALLSAAAVAAPLALAPLYAQESATRHVPFTQAAFEAAQAAGKPILVDVYAPWCPVCRAQQAPIAAAQADPANADLVVFRLDFDSQKAEQRPLRVTGQATLIDPLRSDRVQSVLVRLGPCGAGEFGAPTRAAQLEPRGLCGERDARSA